MSAPEFDDAAIARFHAALDEDDRRRARRRRKAESLSVWVAGVVGSLVVLALVVTGIVAWVS
jgi:hypothetical protein